MLLLNGISYVRRWTRGTFAEHHRPMAGLEMDEAAFRAGYATGLAGDSRPCPYRVRSREAWSWSSGLIEGQAKRNEGFRPPLAGGIKF